MKKVLKSCGIAFEAAECILKFLNRTIRFKYSLEKRGLSTPYIERAPSRVLILISSTRIYAFDGIGRELVRDSRVLLFRFLISLRL